MIPSIPSDFNSEKYPVSIKGIVIINDKLVLLKNERNEWELPGGKIEKNESSESCVIREIKKELNIDCKLDKLVDVWMYNILNIIDVFIVIYLCKPLLLNENEVNIRHEYKEISFFYLSEIDELEMPMGYRNSIKKV